MGINERVDSYYGRMQDVLQRMGVHQIHDNFLMNIFIGGLYPIELKTYVKEAQQPMRKHMVVPKFGRSVIWKTIWSSILTTLTQIIPYLLI